MKKKKLPSSENLAEIELVYKSKFRNKALFEVRNSKDAFQLINGYWDKLKIRLLEESKLLLLNRANKIIGLMNLSIGGSSSTIVDVKFIVFAAVKSNAHGIILVHNHPSGCLRPSEADLRLTTKIRSAIMLFDIKLLDHLIISAEGYYSMADEGDIS